jgi:hypothetical protein
MAYEHRADGQELRITGMSQLDKLSEPNCIESGCSMIMAVTYLINSRQAC